VKPLFKLLVFSLMAASLSCASAPAYQTENGIALLSYGYFGTEYPSFVLELDEFDDYIGAHLFTPKRIEDGRMVEEQVISLQKKSGLWEVEETTFNTFIWEEGKIQRANYGGYPLVKFFWEGEQLSRAELYYGEALEYTFEYSYQEGRLTNYSSASTDPQLGFERTDFALEYENDKISRISIIYDGETQESEVLEYDESGRIIKASTYGVTHYYFYSHPGESSDLTGLALELARKYHPED
jgi:hypothetical protein